MESRPSSRLGSPSVRSSCGRQELPVWLEKLNDPHFAEQFREDAMEKAIVEQQIQIDELATTIRFFHRHPLRYVSDKLKAKLKSQIKARLKPRH